MIRQIYRSTVFNKSRFDLLYEVPHLKEVEGRYKLFDSAQVLSAWIDQLGYATTDIRAIMTANQIANTYVERHPYTMLIKDDECNQPDPGSEYGNEILGGCGDLS